MILTLEKSNRAAGEASKRSALALLEARRELFVLRGRRALLQSLLCSGTATADDVRNAVELPPEIGPKCFGAVPGALAKMGIIQREGYVPTARSSARARPVSVWRLVDHSKAADWLRDNPDRFDPDESQRDGPQRLLFGANDGPAGGTAGPGGR